MATADEPLTPFGACPLLQSRYDQVLLGHGSGGQLRAELIQRIFVPAFANDVLTALEDQATLTLPAMRAHPLGRNAAIVGEVTADHPGMVILRSVVGGERLVTMLMGEQLP